MTAISESTEIKRTAASAQPRAAAAAAAKLVAAYLREGVAVSARITAEGDILLTTDQPRISLQASNLDMTDWTR